MTTKRERCGGSDGKPALIKIGIRSAGSPELVSCPGCHDCDPAHWCADDREVREVLINADEVSQLYPTEGPEYELHHVDDDSRCDTWLAEAVDAAVNGTIMLDELANFDGIRGMTVTLKLEASRDIAQAVIDATYHDAPPRLDELAELIKDKLTVIRLKRIATVRQPLTAERLTQIRDRDLKALDMTAGSPKPFNLDALRNIGRIGYLAVNDLLVEREVLAAEAERFRQGLMKIALYAGGHIGSGLLEEETVAYLDMVRSLANGTLATVTITNSEG